LPPSHPSDARRWRDARPVAAQVGQLGPIDESDQQQVQLRDLYGLGVEIHTEDVPSQDVDPLGLLGRGIHRRFN
jgi:hypothetical protein